jgi:predicted MFS family arabinose efflux permease
MEKKALLAMCFLGLGEVIGSLFNGWLEDKLGPKKMVFVNMIEMGLALASIIWFAAKDDFSLWSAALFNFFWGIQDAGVNTFIYCICGF